MREWFKEMREGIGLTQSQLAEKIGVTEAYCSLIENGKRQKKMDIQMAYKLAEVFDVPVMEIVELETMEDEP